MGLYGFMIDSKLVDEITDRVLSIHDHAEFDNRPFDSYRQSIINAVEDVLRRHNIVAVDYEHLLTNLKKEEI